MIKKYGAPLLLSIVLCVFLTSCGIPKPPGEEEINRVLPDEIKTLIVENPFDLTNADLYEMETKTTIVKRQTNEKEDFTYCEVQLTSEYYQIVRYLKLNFNYYDEGGWLLDSYSEYQDPEWKLLKCPFNAEEVIYPVCEMFSQVDFKKTEEWLDDGAVDFYFTVEDPRENGTYSGTASVELFFDFDAVRWDYHVNTNQVTFIWDIEGEWQYLENTSTSWGTDVKEISVKIGHFDQEAGTMEGTWYMRADFPILHVHSKNQFLLTDTEQVRIEAGKALVELWDNPDDAWGMHSVVRFYPDKVEASYATHFGTVHLNRVTNFTSVEAPSNTDNPAGNAGDNSIDQSSQDFFKDPRQFAGVMGCKFNVPEGFTQQGDEDLVSGPGMYRYSFYSDELDMSISVFECTFEALPIGPEDIPQEYRSASAAEGVTYATSGKGYYVVSGYHGEESIYYTRIDYGESLYTSLDFEYPSDNADACETVLLEFLNDYSAD